MFSLVRLRYHEGVCSADEEVDCSALARRWCSVAAVPLLRCRRRGTHGEGQEGGILESVLPLRAASCELRGTLLQACFRGTSHDR